MLISEFNKKLTSLLIDFNESNKCVISEINLKQEFVEFNGIKSISSIKIGLITEE